MANSEYFEVVVAGAAFRDVVRFDGNVQVCEGGICYAAATAGELLHSVALFGCIATKDPTLTRENLAMCGVDSNATIDSENGACTFDIEGGDEFAEPHVAHFGSQPSDLALPTASTLPNCKNLLVYPIDVGWAIDVLKVARSSGARTCVDIQHDVRDKAELLALATEADIVFCSESALGLLLEVGNVAEAIEKFASLADCTKVVKRGICGSTVISPKGEIMHLPAYDLNFAKTVGSGDVFDAGFICALEEGKDLYDSGISAARVAGWFVRDPRPDAPRNSGLDPDSEPGRRVGMRPEDYEEFLVYIAGHFHGQIMHRGLERLEEAFERAHFKVVLPHKDIGHIRDDKLDAGEAFVKDLEAIDNCDAVVALLDYANRGGTGFEIGYAYCWEGDSGDRKEIILIATENTGSLSNMFLRSATCEVVKTIKRSVAATMHVLTPWLT